MRLARKSIDTDALLHNYHYLKNCCPHARVLAVVKGDAYGHGLSTAARALSVVGGDASADGFAVAVVPEGLALRRMDAARMILVMQGALDRDELRAAAANGLTLVVHSFGQLAQLERHHAETPALWVKFNTGMNRLGFPAEAADEVVARVKRLFGLPRAPVLMSHFAYADEADMAEEDEAQWGLFERIRSSAGLAASIANSTGALCRPQSRLEWVRVGIALYGAPCRRVAPEHHARLRPVMRVTAPLIAVRQCRAGEGVGYGGAYVCPRDMKVGIIGIGYGDGYPCHARNGTPVWLGGMRRELVGRVSMDMIAVALGDNQTVAVGDVAELWGPNLPVAEVAGHCGTISYELLCAVQGMAEAQLP